jgi:hypothetical protein
MSISSVGPSSNPAETPFQYKLSPEVKFDGFIADKPPSFEK